MLPPGHPSQATIAQAKSSLQQQSAKDEYIKSYLVLHTSAWNNASANRKEKIMIDPRPSALEEVTISTTDAHLIYGYYNKLSEVENCFDLKLTESDLDDSTVCKYCNFRPADIDADLFANHVFDELENKLELMTRDWIARLLRKLNNRARIHNAHIPTRSVDLLVQFCEADAKSRQDAVSILDQALSELDSYQTADLIRSLGDPVAGRGADGTPAVQPISATDERAENQGGMGSEDGASEFGTVENDQPDAGVSDEEEVEALGGGAPHMPVSDTASEETATIVRQEDRPEATAGVERQAEQEVAVVRESHGENVSMDKDGHEKPTGVAPDHRLSRRVSVAELGPTVARELLSHREDGKGRLLGLAGLPRHGKTTLADRLRETATKRQRLDFEDFWYYKNKTEGGDVNVYGVPTGRQHNFLVDMAGDDYQALGNYDKPLPSLMEHLLWRLLPGIDGLVLLMALPVVWRDWNDGTDLDQGKRRSAEAAQRAMIEAHTVLLKYALVARYRDRLRGFPELGLKSDEPPSRNQVDDAYQKVPSYDRPVTFVFSKADLYDTPNRDSLRPPLPPARSGRMRVGIHPEQSDPLLVAAEHFPELLEFLRKHFRYFKWSFCQSVEDHSENPDPVNPKKDQLENCTPSLIGGEAVLDFVTNHPWRFPGISTNGAIWLDEKVFRRQEWAAVRGGG